LVVVLFEFDDLLRLAVVEAEAEAEVEGEGKEEPVEMAV
jgi:hypothetical protein